MRKVKIICDKCNGLLGYITYAEEGICIPGLSTGPIHCVGNGTHTMGIVAPDEVILILDDRD